MTDQRERRSVRFSDEEWEAIKRVAAAEGRKTGNLIRWIMMQYVEKMDGQSVVNRS